MTIDEIQHRLTCVIGKLAAIQCDEEIDLSEVCDALANIRNDLSEFDTESED